MSEPGRPEISPKRDGSPQGFSTREIRSRADLGVMQRLAGQFGVTIRAIAEEGQPYSHEHKRGTRLIKQLDGTTKTVVSEPGVSHGTVPDGSSYVEIRTGKNDLQDFWKAVKEEQAKAKADKTPGV